MEKLIVITLFLATSATAQVVGPIADSMAWCQSDDQCRITEHQDAANAEAYCADLPTVEHCAAKYELAATETDAVASEVLAARLSRRLKRAWAHDLLEESRWFRETAQNFRTQVAP